MAVVVTTDEAEDARKLLKAAETLGVDYTFTKKTTQIERQGVLGKPYIVNNPEWTLTLEDNTNASLETEE